MNQLNPNAVNLWVLGTAGGFAFDGSHGAAIGLAVASGITFLLTMFTK